MPKTKPRKRKRPRVPKSAENRLAKIRHAAFEMEEPLLDIASFVQALDLIGNGIAARHGEAAGPIMTLASAMSKRLDDLKESWSMILKK